MLLNRCEDFVVPEAGLRGGTVSLIVSIEQKHPHGSWDCDHSLPETISDGKQEKHVILTVTTFLVREGPRKRFTRAILACRIF